MPPKWGQLYQWEDSSPPCSEANPRSHPLTSQGRWVLSGWTHQGLCWLNECSLWDACPIVGSKESLTWHVGSLPQMHSSWSCCSSLPETWQRLPWRYSAGVDNIQATTKPGIVEPFPGTEQCCLWSLGSGSIDTTLQLFYGRSLRFCAGCRCKGSGGICGSPNPDWRLVMTCSGSNTLTSVDWSPHRSIRRQPPGCVSSWRWWIHHHPVIKPCSIGPSVQVSPGRSHDGRIASPEHGVEPKLKQGLPVKSQGGEDQGKGRKTRDRETNLALDRQLTCKQCNFPAITIQGQTLNPLATQLNSTQFQALVGRLVAFVRIANVLDMADWVISTKIFLEWISFSSERSWGSMERCPGHIRAETYGSNCRTLHSWSQEYVQLSVAYNLTCLHQVQLPWQEQNSWEIWFQVVLEEPKHQHCRYELPAVQSCSAKPEPTHEVLPVRPGIPKIAGTLMSLFRGQNTPVRTAWVVRQCTQMEPDLYIKLHQIPRVMNPM